MKVFLNKYVNKIPKEVNFIDLYIREKIITSIFRNKNYFHFSITRNLLFLLSKVRK